MDRWYFPEEFRFGAHDSFPTSVDGKLVKHESVMLDPDKPGSKVGQLSHTVVTVKDGWLIFYRDGKRLGDRIKLPRNVTDCINPDVAELGDARIALLAFKFYPRALNDNEIQEMYEGGAPLVEVATGTTLKLVQEDSLKQARSHPLRSVNLQFIASALVQPDSYFPCVCDSLCGHCSDNPVPCSLGLRSAM